MTLSKRDSSRRVYLQGSIYKGVNEGWYNNLELAAAELLLLQSLKGQGTGGVIRTQEQSKFPERNSAPCQKQCPSVKGQASPRWPCREGAEETITLTSLSSSLCSWAKAESKRKPQSLGACDVILVGIQGSQQGEIWIQKDRWRTVDTFII